MAAARFLHDEWLRRIVVALALLMLLTVADPGRWLSAQATPGRIGSPPSATLFTLTVRAYFVAPDADWHREVSTAYGALGDPEASLAHLAAAATQSSDPVQWHTVATRFLERGDWAAARQALETILNLASDDPLAHYWLGVLIVPYNTREAYTHFATAGRDPALAAAAQTLRETIAATQMDNPAYQSAALGMALAGLEHWPQAEQAFVTAATLDPTYAEAWAYLALARAQQGKEATAAAAQAASLAPQNALVAYLLGLTWRAGGDYTRSRLALAQAQQMEPQNPAFAAELGDAYRLEGNLPLAEQWFRQAAILAGNEDTFLNLLALFYADTLHNLTGNGLAVLQEAAAQEPSNATIQAAYGWVLFNLGQTEAAQESVQLALSLEPDNPRALYYLGLIAQMQGRRDEAISALLRLLDHSQPQGFDVLARRALENMGYR